ncbi:ATP-binding cassette domain-containing protein, partial [Lactiplantibacillus plantarum]
MANEPLIQVKNLKKAFGNHEVLTDINLDVQAGEVVSIIGRSGSGKSTL